MKIVLCGSISFAKQMVEAAEFLKQKGFQALLPEMAVPFSEGKFSLDNFKDGRTDAAFKKHYNLIRKHFAEIEKGDVILVLNYGRKGIANYIGGATFAEMAVAYYLCKPIYLLNPVPQGLPYTSEMEAMDPIVLKGDLNNICPPAGK